MIINNILDKINQIKGHFLGQKIEKKPEQLNALNEHKVNTDEYWASIKDFGMAGVSVVTGDPEAMKTLVDVLANAVYKGIEKIDVKNDQQKQEIKLKIENAINEGADSLMNAFTKFQEAAQASNKKMRSKYGRKKLALQVK